MVLTRPITKTKISTTEFGHPVYDWIVANTPTPWVNLTYANGWVNLAAPRPGTRYRKIGDVLMLNLGCQSGSLNATIGQLPVGFRPSFTIDAVIRCGGAPGWLNALTDGNLIVYGADNTLVAGLVSIPLT
jgi:hypothetical protein